MKTPKELFDSERYLKANPDVAADVEQGRVSAWGHYLFHGFYEGRSGVPDPEEYGQLRRFFERGPDVPIPPRHLAERVHGPQESFAAVGRFGAYDLYDALISHDAAFPPDGNILDFGCGCGRTLRWMPMLFPRSSLWATDIDSEAISWCEKNLAGIARFDTNEFIPPTRYDDDQFDIIYSISVFTHLPENMQFIWLAELARIAAPEAWLALTVHSSAELNSATFPKKIKHHTINRGFYYEVNGPTTPGLPSFYRQTYHSWDYIRAQWSRHFEIVAIIARGMNNHQDIVLCRPTKKL